MKVEHVKEQQKEITYPCLMIGERTNEIVFMFDKCKGVVLLRCDSHFEIGYYSSTWLMERFTPLPSTEQIILQND